MDLGAKVKLLNIEKVIILKSIDLFSKIPESDLLILAMEFETVRFKANTVVMTQGDIGNSMYILASGEVNVDVDTQRVATLKDKNIFGELAIFDPEPRSATITTTKDTVLFTIKSDVMYDLISRYPNVSRGIIKILSKRVREKNNTAVQ